MGNSVGPCGLEIMISAGQWKKKRLLNTVQFLCAKERLEQITDTGFQEHLEMHLCFPTLQGEGRLQSHAAQVSVH